jgi:fibronectin-binding autotransporter adhesin
MENSEVYNSGDIISSYGNAIETTGYGVNRIVNSQFGTIQGHAVGNVGGTAGAAIVGGEGNDIVENAGTITGDVLLGGGEDLYVATGGKVTGNLDMGDGNDTVLTRGGSTIDVSGTATGGDGADAIGRSFTTSGIFDLATNTLGNSFELHGVEASGRRPKSPSRRRRPRPPRCACWATAR